MALGVGADRTRTELRTAFQKWRVAEWSIDHEPEVYAGGQARRGNGVTVRYLRNGTWQSVSCRQSTYAENLRQIFFFLDRLRIAERHGIVYQGLTSSKEVAKIADVVVEPQQELEDAYDILGVSSDDPTDLVKQVYQRKVMFYHPDKGGDPEKFKRITKAYELIMQIRDPKGGT